MRRPVIMLPHSASVYSSPIPQVYGRSAGSQGVAGREKLAWISDVRGHLRRGACDIKRFTIEGSACRCELDRYAGSPAGLDLLGNGAWAQLAGHAPNGGALTRAARGGAAGHVRLSALAPMVMFRLGVHRRRPDEPRFGLNRGLRTWVQLWSRSLRLPRWSPSPGRWSFPGQRSRHRGCCNSRHLLHHDEPGLGPGPPAVSCCSPAPCSAWSLRRPAPLYVFWE